MSNKQEKTEYSFAQASSTYQTGSTKPPKSHRGVILFLLGLVIFLGGIATALGLTNLQLFRALNGAQEESANAVCFSDSQEQAAATSEASTGFGFRGETVSEFWHTYHNMPRGVFIQSVEVHSAAAQQGLLPGDILTQVGDTPIESLEQLQALLEKVTTEQITVTIYREETYLTLELPVAKGGE